MEGQNIVVSIVYWTCWCIGKMIFIPLKYGFWGIVYLIQKRRARPKEFHSSDTSRFEHTLIAGGSGHGKTQLMQYLFVQDLPRLIAGGQSTVIIDSQGDMIKKILALAALAPDQPLAKRLIVIDPTDSDFPPCLNLFDFGLDRIKEYDRSMQQAMMNATVALYEYMFSSLLGAEMTNRQEVIFKYLALIMMQIPNATIYTLLDFIEEPELVRQYLPKLDISAQRFFLTQFFSSSFDATRTQIANRLWGLIATDSLRNLFSHTHNKINFFEAMNNGSLILINTAKGHLQQDGCELFGRFMIALLTQATLERDAIPEEKRTPTFIFVDEAQDYFADNKINLLLSQARKFKVEITLATQTLGQYPRQLLDIVISSTAIKYAGGVSKDDARDAPNMRCDPESIMTLQKFATHSHFAFYDKNVTFDKPGAYEVIFGVLEGLPKMSKEQQTQLLADNRDRYCAPYNPNLLIGSQAFANAGIQFDLETPRVL